jgi:hypothetical protein
MHDLLVSLVDPKVCSQGLEFNLRMLLRPSRKIKWEAALRESLKFASHLKDDRTAAASGASVSDLQDAHGPTPSVAFHSSGLGSWAGGRHSCSHSAYHVPR